MTSNLTNLNIRSSWYNFNHVIVNNFLIQFKKKIQATIKIEKLERNNSTKYQDSVNSRTKNIYLEQVAVL